LFALIGIASAAPQYGLPILAPSYGPAPVPVYPDTVPAYDYSYGVADGYSGANFGASESRNGYATSGEYHVNLPDGRIQTVTYTADDVTGYVADVKYSGEPVYAAAPVPAYGPAPAYGVAPVRVAAPIVAPAPYGLRPAVVRAPLAPIRANFYG